MSEQYFCLHLLALINTGILQTFQLCRALTNNVTRPLWTTGIDWLYALLCYSISRVPTLQIHLQWADHGQYAQEGLPRARQLWGVTPGTSISARQTTVTSRANCFTRQQSIPTSLCSWIFSSGNNGATLTRGILSDGRHYTQCAPRRSLRERRA